MTAVAHLIIGPTEHGVVRHAELVARACGHEIVKASSLSEVESLAPYDVVHVPFTDRLFASTLDGSEAAFGRVSDAVRAVGAELSVTLHDVPHDDSALQRQRRALYRRVVAGCRGVVVNSRLELSLVEDWAGDVHSLRLAPLPVGPAPRADRHVPVDLPVPAVTVLGFVYPNRGYEEVIAALPDGCSLIAVGRPSAGHEDLPGRYAVASEGRWQLTGYLPDDVLASYLLAAQVPIAPNRRVTASASINSWLAHGRRPLVPDGRYARELVEIRPGAITLYDADDPDSLPRAIAAALDDPASTWLADDVHPGPSVGDVAAIYRSHLAACAPPAPLVMPSGCTVVPANRWDLVDTVWQPPADVSVVVAYFEAQKQLDLVLTGLRAQTHPAVNLEVIVVDDGSCAAPDLSLAGELRIRLLRQDDRGFRAARARNVGAEAADGEVLAFLDGDTVPEPGYVAAISRLPALCPDVLAVGRRRHADFSDVGAVDLAAWWDGQAGVPELPEPDWLREGYRRSHDLLDVDARSYRYVISAVLAMHTQLFEEVGGFDERFVGYGGEDWELGHRCYVAGAVLAHVRDAVAWHDGPDWGGRGGSRQVGAKNAETVALCGLLPDMQARGGGQWLPYPSVVVLAPAMTDVDLMATARTAFATGADCGIWVDGVGGPSAELVLADPRLHLGRPAADVMARALCVADLDGPANLSTLSQLSELAQRHGQICAPALRVSSTRGIRRSSRWAADDDPAALAAWLFGRHDRSAPVRLRDLDLAMLLSDL